MFCIYCGASNPTDASFCRSCGKVIGETTDRQTQPMVSSPAPPQIQPQSAPAAPRKNRVGVWILVGFVSCLIVVIAAILALRPDQAAPETNSSGVIPDSAPAPAPTAAPAAVPAQDKPPVPDNVPVQPPAPTAAAPQNPIAGEWKTTTLIGDTILNFGTNGRYSIKSALVGETGVYVFSNDGTLRLQQDAIFSHDIVVWSCQLSGNTLSVVDPEGAGHVYTRVQ